MGRKVRGNVERDRQGTATVKWIILFVICFGFGIFLTNLWRGELITQGGFLDNYTLLCIKQVEMDYMGYFLFLLKKRVGETVLLGILASTYLGIAAIYICIGWFGLASGVFLAGAGIQHGTKGILLFLGGMIPHQIILIPCSIILFLWCYNLCTSLYYPNRCPEPMYGSKKQFVVRKLMQFIVILGVVIIGCLMECYVNPYVVTKLLKLF